MSDTRRNICCRGAAMRGENVWLEYPNGHWRLVEDSHERALKSPLHRVFCILLIAKDAKSHAIGFELVTLVEFSQGVLMP